MTAFPNEWGLYPCAVSSRKVTVAGVSSSGLCRPRETARFFGRSRRNFAEISPELPSDLYLARGVGSTNWSCVFLLCPQTSTVVRTELIKPQQRCVTCVTFVAPQYPSKTSCQRWRIASNCIFVIRERYADGIDVGVLLANVSRSVFCVVCCDRFIFYLRL